MVSLIALIGTSEVSYGNDCEVAPKVKTLTVGETTLGADTKIEDRSGTRAPTEAPASAPSPMSYATKKLRGVGEIRTWFTRSTLTRRSFSSLKLNWVVGYDNNSSLESN